MVMATKKTNVGINSKKTTVNQPAKASALLRFVKKWWWAILLITLLVFGVTSFAYEKYLDRQNMADMKLLLADFEQLEKDVEAETGEELYIESSCGSVGKFSESYSCNITLLNSDTSTSDELINLYRLFNEEHLRCEILLNAKEKYKNALDCTIHVRGSNIKTANRIFY